MNIKKNTVNIKTPKIICEKTSVHPVTAAFVLPDYYPDVSRIMKTSADASVISWNVKGKELTYELCVKMNVIYKSNESELLQSYSQVQNISATSELEEECSEPVCSVKTSVSSFSCRAKSERRIEFDGSVMAFLKVCSDSDCELLCDCFGNGIHVKKGEISFIKKLSSVTKDFTVSEEIPVNDSNISGTSVLQTDVFPEITEISNVSGKTLIKGILNASVLYTFASDNEDNIRSLNTPLSFSRVVNLKNKDINDVLVNADISPFDISCRPVNDAKGSLKNFEISCGMKISCSSFTYEKADFIEDIYSTKFNTSTAFSHIVSVSPELCFEKLETVKSFFECSSIKKIYDFRCSVKNIRSKFEAESKEILSEGTILAQIIARNIDNSIIITEKEIPFDIRTKHNSITENSSAECTAFVKRCSYNIISDDKADIEIEIKLNFKMSDKKVVKAVTEINIDEEKEAVNDSSIAFRVCFAEAGEFVWNIAKKYRTDAKAIMESNGLTSDITETKQALLIPMTD